MRINNKSISKTLEQASELSRDAKTPEELMRVIRVTRDILDFHSQQREPEILLPQDVWKDA